MIPPMLMHVKIKEPGRRGFALWLPLVLLWPLFLLLALLALPIALLVAICTLAPLRTARALKAFYEMGCALRGLAVDVHNKDTTVVVHVW